MRKLPSVQFTHPLLWRASSPPPRKLVYHSGPPLWTSRHRLNTYTMASFGDFCQKTEATSNGYNFDWIFKLLASKIEKAVEQTSSTWKFFEIKGKLYILGNFKLVFWTRIPNSDHSLCSGVETTFRNNFIYKKIFH